MRTMTTGVYRAPVVVRGAGVEGRWGSLCTVCGRLRGLQYCFMRGWFGMGELVQPFGSCMNVCTVFSRTYDADSKYRRNVPS